MAFVGLVPVVALKVVVKPVGTNPLILSNGTLILKKEYSSKMEHSYQKWNSSKTEHSSNMELIKNGTLILSKWNTHQK